MPKQEVGSTKWLGNKMKAKGLQKLRWYCQMCQKQCRDENGFKCHRSSDGHQRQMQLFVQDPNRFMDEFSQEFEVGFIQLMSHTYSAQRVLANTVYADFISNRHHTHMNSTIWVTLSNFVQYLGRTNQCKIDKTPKGWYLQYIDNSPEARMRQAKAAEKEHHELEESERHQLLLAEMIQRAGPAQESEFTELQREEGDAPIAFAMGGASSSSKKPEEDKKRPAPGNVFGDGSSDEDKQGKTGSGARASSRDEKGKKEEPAKKLSVVEQIRMEHEATKRRKLDKDKSPSPSSEESGEPWVAAGLVVKVMHQELKGGKFYRKKGRIEKVHDQYTADVRMVDTKDLIRLEQELLETVIPNVGKIVKIVKGSHKGHKATMRNVDFESFSVSVELDDGTIMEGMGYDEVCKTED